MTPSTPTGIRGQRAAAWLVAAAAALAATMVVAGATAARSPGRDATSTPSGVPFAPREVLSGYSQPVFVTNSGAPNRLFIVQQGGRIKVANRTDATADWVKKGTFLDVTSLVETGGNEQGLLGLAFHPNYSSNGRFYVYYTRDGDGRLMLDEFRRQTTLRADPGSRRNVLGIPHAAADNHNGGWTGFGPDGYLYIATGDGGADSSNGQDTDTRLGKILRVDPLDPDGPGPAKHTVPVDNPFVGVAGHDLVWAYGLRNPWRDSFDSETGDLWIGDVGAQAWEEIDHSSGPNAGKGDDYGWDLCEGDHPFTGTELDCGEPPNTTLRPVAEYPNPVSGPSAVVGGYVYRGADQPSLVGTYFFADTYSGDITAIPNDFDLAEGDTLPAPLSTSLNPSSFGVDGRDELYVVDLSGGGIHLIEED